MARLELLHRSFKNTSLNFCLFPDVSCICLMYSYISNFQHFLGPKSFLQPDQSLACNLKFRSALASQTNIWNRQNAIWVPIKQQWCPCTELCCPACAIVSEYSNSREQYSECYIFINTIQVCSHQLFETMGAGQRGNDRLGFGVHSITQKLSAYNIIRV